MYHRKDRSIDYFISYFEELSTRDISYSSFANDAWFWLTDEDASVLYTLIEPYGLLLAANDGVKGYNIFGNEPHERVINFLYYVKAKLENANEKTKV